MRDGISVLGIEVRSWSSRVKASGDVLSGNIDEGHHLVLWARRTGTHLVSQRVVTVGLNSKHDLNFLFNIQTVGLR